MGATVSSVRSAGEGAGAARPEDNAEGLLPAVGGGEREAMEVSRQRTYRMAPVGRRSASWSAGAEVHAGHTFGRSSGRVSRSRAGMVASGGNSEADALVRMRLHNERLLSGRRSLAVASENVPAGGEIDEVEGDAPPRWIHVLAERVPAMHTDVDSAVEDPLGETQTLAMLLRL
eukprot:ctg_194.g136